MAVRVVSTSPDGSKSFGVSSFNVEPEIPEPFGSFDAYASGTDVSDALASWKPPSEGRFGVAWATPERGARRGRGTAAATRGAAARAGAAADLVASGPIAAVGAEASPKKRSSKRVEDCDGCKDALAVVPWSNRKRSPKAERADGGSDRSSGFANANRETSRASARDSAFA